jgi:chitin disaccharide deacetylase
VSQAHYGTTAGLLGYPDDARLLLVNADDFGMYDAINAAVVRAFAEGIVRSTSLMVPCPGAAEAMRLLKENPDLPFGVHLSVVRDIAHYRWGPLAPRERVPSLLAEDGDLYPLDRMAELLTRA